MTPRAFSSLFLFLYIFLSVCVEHVLSSPVAPRPDPQRQNDQAVLQPAPAPPSAQAQGSQSPRLTTTFVPTTMATVLLKRDASSLDASSISSVLATGLPISILSLAATNPAAASSWIAAEVLQTASTGAWYKALPTAIQSHLYAQATAAAAAAATATSATTTSSSSSSQSTVDAKEYAFSAASYHMSGAAVAGVVLGSFGFVAMCYALFAWQARLGPFARWAPRGRPAQREGYERAASRAALRREFKGSRLDLSEFGDRAEVEMGEGVGKGGAGGGVKDVGGGDGDGDGDGDGGKDGGEGGGGGGGGGVENGRPMTGDRESVVTALPRYRPSVFGNAARWKAGWPSVWLSRR